MTMSKNRKTLYKIITVGLMAALVYAGNYLQIKIPNGVLVTRIHLGNSMCLLAGLLFGGLSGGLASGIGAGLYDLFDPVYIVSAPYTFISKFAMGFTAGFLRKKGTDEKRLVIFSAIAGQFVYILLYLLKSYFTIIIIGGTPEAAWTAVGTNAITSSVNAVLAVLISVPLYFALKKALSNTAMYSLIAAPKERTENKWFNPLTGALTAFSVIVAVVFAMNLSAANKIAAKEEEEKLTYEEKIESLENQIVYLYNELGIDFPNEEITID